MVYSLPILTLPMLTVHSVTWQIYVVCEREHCVVEINAAPWIGRLL